ncbi:dimethylsulfonioproprionate lyase family protein [Paralimibaculum aggregatum]|nr:dimethylsulfonioproprionate lyase family protein [Limibaculum sp. NKW23]
MALQERADDGAARRLSAEPDWIYLLTEIYELYRNSGAGGSTKIRSHQRAVREAIRRVQAAAPSLRFPEPAAKPVTAHLRRAFDRGRLTHMAPLVRAIENVSGRLAWLHGYDRMPRGLAERYAFAEFTGPSGPVETREIILGLVLFAPGCTYPAHAHDGITESYYVLSGTVSENDDGVYAPGSMIFNPPGRMHRITVGARDPALLVYAWAGSQERLAGQKMTFSRKPRAG